LRAFLPFRGRAVLGLGRASLVFPYPERLCISGSVWLFCRETFSVRVVRLQHPKVVPRTPGVEARNERLPVETRNHRRTFAALLSDDERPQGGGVAAHFEWSPQDISKLISASEDLGKRPEARYDYSPLIRLLVSTGLRVSEALALRWEEVDLLDGTLRIKHSLNRDGTLGPPKTKAGEREVWLSPGLVDLLVALKPLDALEEDFVFASKRTPDRPLSYFNFRRRGFEPALEKAGLDGKGITIHTLRSAAISIYASSGLTLEETAKVMGQAQPHVAWRNYYRLFDKSNVAERVRAAQERIVLPD
jgi:integrase